MTLNRRIKKHGRAWIGYEAYSPYTRTGRRSGIKRFKAMMRFTSLAEAMAWLNNMKPETD